MKKKRYSPAERAAMFNPTYFFGYGSLMQPSGINGRGMKVKYTSKDLHKCTLHGFARSMCGYFGGRNFYGLLEDKSSYCNGVVFKISSWYDYRALLYNEGAVSAFRKYRTYWPLDVTNLIKDWAIPADHRVIALICKSDKSRYGRVERRYIRICHDAANKWGPEFKAEFLKTGGIPYDWRRMREISKQHNIKFW